MSKKEPTWIWAFKKWYYWLLVIFFAYIQLGPTRIVDDVAYFFGLLIGVALGWWVLFTLGRWLYLLGKKNKEEKKGVKGKKTNWREVLSWIIVILLLFGFVGLFNNEDKVEELEDEVRELEDRAVDYRIEINELESELSSCESRKEDLIESLRKYELAAEYGVSPYLLP